MWQQKQNFQKVKECNMVLTSHMGEKNSSTQRTGKGKESYPTDASSLENFHSRYENE